MSVKSTPAVKRDNTYLIIGIVVVVAVIALLLLVFAGGTPAPASVQTRQSNDQFLAENGQQEGVMTTASGLQYRLVTDAPGDVFPSASDTVTVNYEGRLLDGTVFDSSYQRGTPATFPLNGVIQGWTEGLQLMTVGDKYTFWIPADLGYGEQGQGPIPANSVLVFDVELLGINGDPQ